MSVNNDFKVVDHNLSWFSFPARVVRLCVFKFGILSKSTVYERFFLDRFHNNAAGLGFCGFSQNFDMSRAKKRVDVLKELGGTEHFIVPKDQEAKLQVIQLKASEIRDKIQSFGGAWVKDGNRIVIKGPSVVTKAWNNYYKSVLKKVFSDEKIEDGKRILVTSENAENIPFFSFWGRKTEVVLLAALAKSFVLNKQEIAYFLGKGIDVCAYDTRGVLNSVGSPSEGGLYNDIEAIGSFLFETEKYSPAKTCIYGSCGESFSAMNLFRKYHDRGINLFLQNAPASLDHVVSRINVIARWIFRIYKGYIRASIDSVCHLAPEDGFSAFSKIDQLGMRSSGYVLLAKTKGDTTAAPQDIDQMAEKIKEHGGVVEVLENDPKHSSQRGHTDPHLADPLINPYLQDEIIRQLF